MKTILLIGLLFLAVLGLGYFGGRYHERQSFRAETVLPDTVYTVKTLIDTVIKPRFRIVERIDTVYEERSSEELWREALAYWERSYIPDDRSTKDYTYAAVMDTVFSDSLLTARVSFHSPIPLHYESYFDARLTWRRPGLSMPAPRECRPGFWSHFGIGLFIGPAYDFTNKKLVPVLGIGGVVKW